MESTRDTGGQQDARVTAYVNLIRTAEALHANVSRGLAREGLTASQFSTIKVLTLRGPLAQRDIAKHLLKTGGNVTVVVDNLERQGLVSRIRDTEDRRIVFVKLTDAGRAIFDRVYAPHLDRIRESMGEITERECHELCALLEKLRTGEASPVCSASAREVAEAVLP